MNILKTIVENAAPALEAAKRRMPLNRLEQETSFHPKRGSFAGAFHAEGIRILAELKKASPSKGLIREDFNPVPLAVELENAGAAALSVLTESSYFLGSLDYLKAVSEHARIPRLRKDFLVDAYQIYEARYFGANAVLLIAALLDKTQFRDLTDTAHALGLDVLGEAHCETELEMVLDSPVDLIGVNARDLTTFHCSPEQSAALIRRIPAGRPVIAESAIHSREDILRLKEAGASGFLIGEMLMRAKSPGAQLKELL